jgi:hypothetical protein
MTLIGNLVFLVVTVDFVALLLLLVTLEVIRADNRVCKISTAVGGFLRRIRPYLVTLSVLFFLYCAHGLFTMHTDAVRFQRNKADRHAAKGKPAGAGPEAYKPPAGDGPPPQWGRWGAPSGPDPRRGAGFWRFRAGRLKAQRDLFLSASGLALHLGFLAFGYLAQSWSKQLEQESNPKGE